MTLHPHWQAIWGDFWKHKVEKNQTNATNMVADALISHSGEKSDNSDNVS